MPSDTVFRFAVLSDIHVQDLPSAAPASLGRDMPQVPASSERRSYVVLGDDDTNPREHPIAGLLQLIREHSLTVDAVLCPGDLGDQANPRAIQHAWTSIQSVAKTLSASHTFATCGNHDVDSRYKHNSWDAKGALQCLTPPFPFPDSSHNDRYWARHFVIDDSHALCRVVVLNSAAYHGGPESEYAHGRISDYTLASLETALTQLPPRPVSILLCHHHPTVCNPLEAADYEVMHNGRKLLDLLGSGNFGRWIVVHGHQHYPQIRYDSGSATRTVILSAGSLSAILYPRLQTLARNQFYVVTLDLHRLTTLGLVGTVEAFEWACGVGWSRASGTRSFPAHCGFGGHVDPDILSSRLTAQLGSAASIKWSDAQMTIPELRYLLPNDERILVASLERQSYGVSRDSRGCILEVGKRL